MIKTSGAGHTGGSLSCVDILNVLYNYVMNVSPANFRDPDRDRYIQSKGHSVEALYAVPADNGFFPVEDLQTIERYQSQYIGHPMRKTDKSKSERTLPGVSDVDGTVFDSAAQTGYD